MPLPDAVATWSPENEIDRFVHARLKATGMAPAPSADRATLLRRLYYDLIGLPPSPEELQSFVEDTAPDAWERRVDTLLGDPRYGEHWATMWLDLVRYSESDGWNQDAYRPHIWRYRDYVIDAFNTNKPYPDFVREQLAGDEEESQSPDDLIAAGFLRLGIYEYNQRDARGHWNDIMNEMTDTVGDVFFGMSMACARCHDHKFDDISQVDYFRLRAFFEPVVWRDDLVAVTTEEREAYKEQHEQWLAATKGVRAEIDALLKPYYERKWQSTVDKFPLDIQACFNKPEADRTSWEQQMAYLVSRQFYEEAGGPLKNITQEDHVRHTELKKQLAAFDHLKPPPLNPVMTATSFSGAHSPTIIPGDRNREEVSPGFPAALQSPSRPSEPRETKSRTALAQWITDPENPLTTRVIVNRAWQQHFGRGLVASANDFGHNGSAPSHPSLLDWLTSQFIKNGWQFKTLHRAILLSSTWRQSSQHPCENEFRSMDPENTLLWRAPVRRLSAESIRDSMLLLSGDLDSRIGGPSVPDSEPRRAIYVKRFRNDNETFLHTFDMAPGLKSTAQRHRTTTPTQSLALINGPYAHERSRRWSKRLLRGDHHDDASQMLADAMHAAWGTPPGPQDLKEARTFLDDISSSEREAKLADFCHVLFNSNAFLYLP